MRTIFKIVKEAKHQYTTILNKTLQDEFLSWEARGLLAYLLSLPEDWDINISHLANMSPSCKRKRTLTIVEELIRNGYMRKETIRDTNGRIMRVEYRVWESPLFTITSPIPLDFQSKPQESLNQLSVD